MIGIKPLLHPPKTREWEEANVYGILWHILDREGAANHHDLLKMGTCVLLIFYAKGLAFTIPMRTCFSLMLASLVFTFGPVAMLQADRTKVQNNHKWTCSPWHNLVVRRFPWVVVLLLELFEEGRHRVSLSLTKAIQVFNKLWWQSKTTDTPPVLYKIESKQQL